MAKKKTKGNPQPAVANEKSYINSGRARNLPVYKCLINEGWQEEGMADIYVLRKHANGHVTVGIYLVDTYCVGVKDTFFLFNQPEYSFQEKLAKAPIPFVECSYELAHNLIYGAVAYAQELGIEPHPDFKLTQKILEEDTEDIPLQEFEFGRDGRPLLIINSDHPRHDYYLRQLNKHVGPGNFDVVGNHLSPWDDEDLDDDYLDPELWEREDWEAFLSSPNPKDDLDYLPAAVYIFEQAAPIPEEYAALIEDLLNPRPHEITFDPLPDDSYSQSEEELQELEQLNPLLKDIDATDEQLNEAVVRIKANMERWPNNPVFYNYLANAYTLLGQKDQAEAVIQQITDKFPDYFFGKTQYAQTLISQGKAEEVPAIFGNKFDLPSIFPDRNVFHYSELLNFHLTMIAYFLAKDEVYTASVYLTVLEEYLTEEDQLLHMPVIIQLKARMIKEADKIIKKAQSSALEREKLIEKLLPPVF